MLPSQPVWLVGRVVTVARRQHQAIPPVRSAWGGCPSIRLCTQFCGTHQGHLPLSHATRTPAAIETGCCPAIPTDPPKTIPDRLTLVAGQSAFWNEWNWRHRFFGLIVNLDSLVRKERGRVTWQTLESCILPTGPRLMPVITVLRSNSH